MNEHERLERNKQTVRELYDLVFNRSDLHWDVLQVVPDESANVNTML